MIFRDHGGGSPDADRQPYSDTSRAHAPPRTDRLNLAAYPPLVGAHKDQEDHAAAASVRENNGVTPLHLVCKLPNPPADIVQALLEEAPDTVILADTHGWIPLHRACASGASGEVLKILTNAYPEGATK